MRNIALLDFNKKVLNTIVVDELFDIDLFIASSNEYFSYVDINDSLVSIGEHYSEVHKKFIPVEIGRGRIFNESKWSWLPGKPSPEDATWLLEFEDEPEGHSELEQKRIYFWSDKFEEWGLIPCSCIPKPDDGLDYVWDSIAKQWQAPTLEKPGENYSWNVFENDWIEISELTYQLEGDPNATNA